MNKYLYAFDLSMDCTGMTIFNMYSFESVIITSIPTNKKKTHGERLYLIEETIKQYIEKYPPDTVVIERGFSRFPTSTQVIYRVHGIINKLFKDYSQIYYPPKKVKEIIIRGDASKEKVKNTILEHYPDIIFSNEDESDSFAVGLCYFIKECGMEWIKNKNAISK